jgi:hypothetical protein
MAAAQDRRAKHADYVHLTALFQQENAGITDLLAQ